MYSIRLIIFPFLYPQGLSTTQIGYLTTSQANAVTASQQEALSTSQLQALVAAGATDLTDSGATGRIIPKLLIKVFVNFASVRTFYLQISRIKSLLDAPYLSVGGFRCWQLFLTARYTASL